MKKIFSSILFVFLTSIVAIAQVKQHVKWEISISPNAQVGKEATLTFEATIEEGWHLYSSDFDPDLGPQIAELELADNSKHALKGKLISINPTHKHDDIWEGEVSFFEKTGKFTQKIIPSSVIIEGKIKAQVCQDMGQCSKADEKFRIEIAAIPAKAEIKASEAHLAVSTPEDIIEAEDTAKADAVADQTITVPDTNSKVNSDTKMAAPVTTEEVSLITFMILAFGAGILALLTPCVFPMIPMTVTYFTKGQKTRAKGIQLALWYGFSIVFIYTVIGFIVAKVAGPSAANWLSTHWLPNILFFIIFIIFALSFLGMFEIVLPNSLINKADAQADRGGFVGVFFMALTLVLISFSCTGPIVGSLLVKAANGEILRPVAGMFAFSLAFSIPFTLFAIFPSWLQSLPRSGGWLNTVKISLGFAELALSLKFLSQADQAYGWHLLDRDIFLVIHIVVLFALGLYLLGLLKLEKDEIKEGISVPRLVIGISVWICTLYLFTGLLGAPLKAMSGYLPPAHTSPWINEAEVSNVSTKTKNNLCETPRFGERLKMAAGLEGYFDYQQALACAKKLNKPLFVDFTGHGCANCRRMEENVFVESAVLERLNKDFVIVSLYVDDKTELPQSEWYTSPYDDEVKKTIGDQYSDLQTRKYNTNSQPYYVILDPNTEKQLSKPTAFDLEVNHFINFLNEGKKNFK